MRSAVRESRPRPGDRHRYWYLDGPPVVLPLSALEPDGFAAWSRTADLPPGVRVTYHGNAVRVAFGDAGTVTVPVSAGTLCGFVACAWLDDFPPSGRISFVDQEVFLDMSPEEIQTHNQVKA